MSRVWLVVLGVVVCGTMAIQPVPAFSEESELERLLDKAAELNVTAPWEESQTVLDQIEPLLDQATPDQYARYELLNIRNLALAGDIHAGLDRVEQLLDQPIPTDQRMTALLRAANLAMIARRYEAAFSFLNQALELDPEIDHSGSSTDVFSVATEMLAAVGDTERAIEYGHRSAERAIERAEDRPECLARQRLANAYKVSGDLDSAIGQYRLGLESCRRANDPIISGIVEFGLGDALRRHGEYEEAERRLEAGVAQLQQNDYVPGVTEARLRLAQLHFEQGRIARAEELFAELPGSFEQRERWNLAATAHRFLGEIARHRGDYRKAVEHYEARMKAQERFLNRERAMNLAYLEVAFDIRIKEQELALLREQARVRELEAETRRQQRRLQYLGYVITAFLVVALILLLAHATRERRRYRRMARRDGLTGLNNHTRFFEIAEDAFRSSRERGEPFTLVLGDIDFFKKVNDRYGHIKGDEILRRVAGRLREVFADRAILGRIGGEEFAAIVPGESASRVHAIVEDLRPRLRSSRAGDEPIPLTMSFGIAQAGGEATLQALRERADQALYQAKHAGRDRIVMAESDEEP